MTVLPDTDPLGVVVEVVDVPPDPNAVVELVTPGDVDVDVALENDVEDDDPSETTVVEVVVAEADDPEPSSSWMATPTMPPSRSSPISTSKTPRARLGVMVLQGPSGWWDAGEWSGTSNHPLTVADRHR